MIDLTTLITLLGPIVVLFAFDRILRRVTSRRRRRPVDVSEATSGSTAARPAEVRGPTRAAAETDVRTRRVA